MHKQTLKQNHLFANMSAIQPNTTVISITPGRFPTQNWTKAWDSVHHFAYDNSKHSAKPETIIQENSTIEMLSYSHKTGRLVTLNCHFSKETKAENKHLLKDNAVKY